VRSPRRVWLAPAYVLHQYAYRDTSRIVELFTAEHGRLSLFARGLAAPRSALKGVLRPFQRLLISWTQRSEAGQLLGAEIDGEVTALGSDRLMSGFYLNELLLRLTQRGDPHPEIFLSYAACITALAAGAAEEPTLRRFEKRLLEDLGYGLELGRTASGEPLDPGGYYRFAAERGPVACVAEAPGAIYGRSLADLKAESFEDLRTLKDAKRVLRAALDACLEGRPLKSREILQAMRRREPAPPP
jgi:DNA repair protein RecO (recombination protein O)